MVMSTARGHVISPAGHVLRPPSVSDLAHIKLAGAAEPGGISRHKDSLVVVHLAFN